MDGLADGFRLSDFARLPVGVAVLDHGLRVLAANAAASELVGEALAAGRSATHALGDQPDLARRLAAAAADGERVAARGLRIGARALDLLAHGVGDGRLILTLTDASARLTAEEETARLRERLAESERQRLRLTNLQQGLSAEAEAPTMVGGSGSLARVRDQIARVASTDTTVLIQGETGTGKELVARTLHAESARAGKPFVAVNCAALPESLIESELFGHEKGAFTGADRRRMGKFELADTGTLFLDEAAELPLSAQAKLLRVLQERSLQRVGGSETIRVDVRVLAATHRDLARRVERGLFREDLFYRLNVFRIEVPPLRERSEDLRALAEHFHAQFARRMARPLLPLSEGSIRRILAYRWPGNIRELANAVERATLLADGPELEIELPEAPLRPETGAAREPASRARSDTPAPTAQTRDILLDLSREQLERLHITHALEVSGHKVFGPGGAAEHLDLNPHTLLSRMDKYGIPRPRSARRGAGGGGGAG